MALTTKPCPFCAKRFKATGMTFVGRDGSAMLSGSLECPGCGARGPKALAATIQGIPAAEYSRLVVAAWNRRDYDVERRKTSAVTGRRGPTLSAMHRGER